jgi:hypothetical protein
MAAANCSPLPLLIPHFSSISNAEHGTMTGAVEGEVGVNTSSGLEFQGVNPL